MSHIRMMLVAVICYRQPSSVLRSNGVSIFRSGGPGPFSQQPQPLWPAGTGVQAGQFRDPVLGLKRPVLVQ